MSWSVGGKGKASEVKEGIAKQFASGSKCIEPEETIRQEAAKLIDKALGAEDPDVTVDLAAYGSQGSVGGKIGHSLNIRLTVEW